MNQFEHYAIIGLIHNEIVRREMERDLRDRQGHYRAPQPSQRATPGRVRLATSRGLMALARRIAPVEPADAGMPAAARH
jgi:hypothetical protein